MRKYHKLSFQITLLWTLILVAFGAVITTTYLKLGDLRDSVNYLSGEVMELNHSALKLKHHLDEMNTSFTKYLSTREGEYLKNLTHQKSHFGKELERLFSFQTTLDAISKDEKQKLSERLVGFTNDLLNIISVHKNVYQMLSAVRLEAKGIEGYFTESLQQVLLSKSSQPFSGITKFLKKHSTSLTFLKRLTPHLDVYSTNKELLKKIQAALDMELTLDEVLIALEGYVTAPTQELKRDFYLAIDHFEEHRNLFFSINKTKKEQKWGEEVSFRFDQLKKKASGIMKSVDLKYKLLKEVDERYTTFVETIQEFSIRPIHLKTKEIKEKTLTEHNTLTSLFLWMMFALLFLGFIVLFFLYKTVSVPMTKITKILRGADLTNLPEEIPITPPNEVRIAAKAIESMIRRLKKEIREKEEAEKTAFHSSRLASIGELAAGMAHEINNPLAIIRLSVEDLEKELETLPANQSSIETELEIQKEAITRITTIVKSLREYTHMNRDEIENVDVVLATEQTLTLVDPIYHKEGIVVKKEFESPLHFKGNTGLFKQVMMNLLSNCRDALETTSQKTISITIMKVNESVHIEVTDTGTGIPEEKLSHIFDLFYTTKPTGKGTGMGLSLCKRYVEEMNGKISCESRTEKGTTFTLTFPLVDSVLE